MGNYTGVAIRLKVKKEAPTELFHFLDNDMFYLNGESEARSIVPFDTSSKAMQEAVSTLCSMTCCMSAYFDAWDWRVKEDCGDHWLYESRASCKSPSEDIFEMLVSGIQEYLILENGDILLRTIYEEGSEEDIVCYVDGKILKREGFAYKLDQGWIRSDERHPGNFKHDKKHDERRRSGELTPFQRYEEDFIPPWDILEIETMWAKQKNREEREWKVALGRDNIGFVF